jgi:hypothetical protein
VVNHFGQLATSLRQRVIVVLSGSPGLDQTSVPKQGKMMAHRGLTLSPQVGAKLRHIPFTLAEEHQHLKPRGVGNLLEKIRDPPDFGG